MESQESAQASQTFAQAAQTEVCSGEERVMKSAAVWHISTQSSMSCTWAGGSPFELWSGGEDHLLRKKETQLSTGAMIVVIHRGITIDEPIRGIDLPG
jgi:hypothetical protein